MIPYHHRRYTHLTPYQVEQFMQHGFIRLRNCWSRAANSKLTAGLWERLGMYANDKSTWREITYLEQTQSINLSEFAPKAWGAICEILGGGVRVREDCMWTDNGFIVNLGSEEFDGLQTVNGRKFSDAEGFHVDGDFFVHYLDSWEQGLLVVPCFSDILEGGGGTVIAPDSIGKIAKWLYDHPGGVTPDLVPYHGEPDVDSFLWQGELNKPEDRYYELQGEVGDVYILHPLMSHSAFQNYLRLPRLITNHNVQLKEPFKFNRSNTEDYSLVELKTLKELEKNNLKYWTIYGDRKEYDKDEAETIGEHWRQIIERLREEAEEHGREEAAECPEE